MIFPHKTINLPLTLSSVPPVLIQTLKDSSCSTLLSHVSVYFELPLLLQRPFLTYSLAVTFFNAGYFVPYAHLVAHSRHAGFSEYQAALVISSTGVTDIAGRLLSGWVSDRARLRLVHMLSVWALLLGLFLLAVPLGTLGGYAGLLTVSLAQGLCAGAMTPLVFAVMPEIAGMERILGALGLLQFIQSVGGLLGAPLSGEHGVMGSSAGVSLCGINVSLLIVRKLSFRSVLLRVGSAASTGSCAMRVSFISLFATYLASLSLSKGSCISADVFTALLEQHLVRDGGEVVGTIKGCPGLLVSFEKSTYRH